MISQSHKIICLYNHVVQIQIFIKFKSQELALYNSNLLPAQC